MRLDAYIVLEHSDISRSRAKTLIESGNVKIDGVAVTKPSFSVDESVEHELEINTESNPFVSRGGLKLDGAVKAFGVKVSGKTCVDIGASTGGFTDCLLTHGASKVYAVDSGSGQLAEILRKDKRVINIEKFNARELSVNVLGEQIDLAVADLSFISQTYILAPAASVLKENGMYIGLIKPQFECGKSAVGKNGIVKDIRQHAHAIKKVISCAEECGFEILAVIPSPIKGGDGNREFLFSAVKKTSPVKGTISDREITETVKVKAGK